MVSADCLFCNAAVPFTQHKMAYHIFELADVDNRWRLCRDCAEFRTAGEEYTGAGHRSTGSQHGPGTCVDCDEDAAYGVALFKETPAGDIVPDDSVYHVLCEEHFEERRA